MKFQDYMENYYEFLSWKTALPRFHIGLIFTHSVFSQELISTEGTHTAAGNSFLLLPLRQHYFYIGLPSNGLQGLGIAPENTFLSSLTMSSSAWALVNTVSQQETCPRSKEKLPFILIVGSLMPWEGVWLNIPWGYCHRGPELMWKQMPDAKVYDVPEKGMPALSRHQGMHSWRVCL